MLAFPQHRYKSLQYQLPQRREIPGFRLYPQDTKQPDRALVRVIQELEWM